MKPINTTIIIILLVLNSCAVTRKQNCNCELKENWEKCIEGQWESNEDTRFTLSFKKGKVIWSYKHTSGIVECEVYDYFFSNTSCDLKYFDRNSDNNIFINYVSNKDTMCYEITSFTNKHFTYIWTTRPNIQSFNRIYSPCK